MVIIEFIKVLCESFIITIFDIVSFLIFNFLQIFHAILNNFSLLSFINIEFLLLAAVFFPLLSCIIVGFFGYLFSFNIVTFLIIFFSGSCVILSGINFYLFTLTHQTIQIFLYPWFFFNHSHCLQWGFLFDSLSISMLLMVSIVSFIVNIYSFSYMGTDPHKVRFFSYLSLFVFFMFFLVTADTLVQLFFGWEGVGLCSYLLVGFWYHRVEANKAALKAIFLNKIGDIFFFLGIIFCYYTFGSLQFSVIFSTIPFFLNETFPILFFEIRNMSFITFCFLLAAIGKSAQLGLHTWLPDAMEGPTPVSALIHAATMVTAGIFLIIRCSWLFLHTPVINCFMLWVGLLTILFAGLVATTQYDIKKVIAFSTCSQLGFMLIGCATGNYIGAFGHLIGHAFFKAVLFLGAGYIIFNLADEQDMRKMGSLAKIPGLRAFLVYFSVGLASLGLVGLVGFTGYYTKEPIVFSFFFSFFSFNIQIGSFILVLLYVGLFLTAYYSIRLLCFVYWGKKTRVSCQKEKNLIFSSYLNNVEQNLLVVSIVFLAGLSLFFGLTVYGNLFGYSSFFYSAALWSVNPAFFIEFFFLMYLNFFHFFENFFSINFFLFNYSFFLPFFTAWLGISFSFFFNNSISGFLYYNRYYNKVYFFLRLYDVQRQKIFCQTVLGWGILQMYGKIKVLIFWLFFYLRDFFAFFCPVKFFIWVAALLRGNIRRRQNKNNEFKSMQFYFIFRRFLNLRISDFLYRIHLFFANKFYFDKLYNICSYSVLRFGFLYCFQFLEKGLFEFFSGSGLSYFFYKLGHLQMRWHNAGFLRYIKIFFFSFFFILFGIFAF